MIIKIKLYIIFLYLLNNKSIIKFIKKKILKIFEIIKNELNLL